MANNKIDRINKEIAKTREKITEYQNKLKGYINHLTEDSLGNLWIATPKGLALYDAELPGRQL